MVVILLQYKEDIDRKPLKNHKIKWIWIKKKSDEKRKTLVIFKAFIDGKKIIIQPFNGNIFPMKKIKDKLL